MIHDYNAHNDSSVVSLSVGMCNNPTNRGDIFRPCVTDPFLDALM